MGSKTVMVSEAKVLRFPVADETITCHVRFPNVSETIQEHGDMSVGMSHVAVAMQRVAERFDDLAILFEECPGASYTTGTHFRDGSVVFIFQIPRRYRQSLLEMGFEPVEVDQ